MFAVALVSVPAEVSMVVEVKPPLWAGAVVEVPVITVFTGVITVLVNVAPEALTEVVISALAGVVDVGLFVDVDIIVVAALSIVLKFVVTVSYFVDVLSNTVVDVLPGVWDGVIIGVVLPSDIGTGVFDGVNVNTFATLVTSLKCATSAPVKEAFGC